MGKKKKQYWGGYLNGKLDFIDYKDPYSEIVVPAIFYTKKEADKRYDDTRKITLATER